MQLPNTERMAALTTTQAYIVRYATQADVPVVLRLLRELAEYEKQLDACKTTENMLLETLSFPISRTKSPTLTTSNPVAFTQGYARALLICPADEPDRVAGLAVYFPNYSTWTGPGIYIEDMIITSAYRGKGYGKALMSALAREVGSVNAYGMGRLQWSVLKWNKPAIDLFKSDYVDAFEKDEYIGLQVEGEKLVELARRR